MFRILTQFKNVNRLKTNLGHLGVDYTMYSGDGSWRREEERSLIIELDNITKRLAEKVARLIKRTNRQKKVLLQEIPVKSQLI